MVDYSMEQFFQTQQDSCAYELTESVAVHTQLAQVQVRGGPRTEVLRCSRSLTLTKILFAINNCLERENQLPPMECCWVYQPHARTGLMPRSNWPTQNGLYVCLFGILVLVSFFRGNCLFVGCF